MERRKSNNYSGIVSRPSFAKVSSPISRNHFSEHRTSLKDKFYTKHTKSSHQSAIDSSLYRNNCKKHTYKRMSTSTSNPIKRGYTGDNDDRPFKKQLVEVTGLEESIVEDVTTRNISPITASEVSAYGRRRRSPKYVDVIQRKQAISKKVRADWSGMPTTAQQGLKNLTGAICYRLSLLQVLLHQPRFVHWLEDFHQPEHCVSDYRERCVCCCLRTMSLEYWRGTPSGTLKVLQAMDSLFKSTGWSPDSVSGHADPDEMTTWIFGVLRSELPSSIFSYLEAIFSPVFTTAVCCRCSFESRTTGHQDSALPLPIQPSIRNGTVTQYLQRYMVEVIEGYRCDACKDNTSIKYRKQLVSYAPNILTVQLKRTDWHGNKLNTPIHIHRTIDLTDYRDAGNQRPLRYELVGVIKHMGTLNFGHYISSTKGPNGDWYTFDDQQMSVTSFAAATSSSGGFTPYILYFQRKEK